VCLNAAAIYAENNKLDLAIDFFQRAADILEPIGDVRTLAYVSLSLADVYRLKQEWTPAVDWANHAAALEINIGNQHGLALAFEVLAKIHQQKGNWETSIQYYHQAKDLFEHLSEKGALASLYKNWGKGLCDRGDRIAATEMWEHSLTLFIETDMDKDADQVRQWLSTVR
jgi:tetratricopeptide (TPR) repeat protein